MQPKIYNRPDARPVPKREKEPIPEYYRILSRDKIIPVFMYVGPSLEDYEEAVSKNEEIEYRKIKIKGAPVAEIKKSNIESVIWLY